MRHAATALRLALTAVLLYLAYRETGPWTAAVLLLLALNGEATCAVLSRKIKISVSSSVRADEIEQQFHGDRAALLDALRRVSR